MNTSPTPKKDEATMKLIDMLTVEMKECDDKDRYIKLWSKRVELVRQLS